MNINNQDTRSLFSLVSTWLILISLCYFAVSGVSPFNNDPVLLRGAETMSSQDQLLSRLTMAVVLGFCLSFVLTKWQPVYELCRRSPAIIVIPFLGVLLSPFADDAFHALTASFVLLATTLLVFYLAAKYSGAEQMRLLLAVGWLMLPASIVFALALPQFGLDNLGGHNDAWKGLFSAKNVLGVGSLLLLIPALLAPSKGSFWRLTRPLYILCALVCIAFSHAATTWILTVIVIGLILAIRLTRKLNKTQSVVMLMLLGGMAVLTAVLMFENRDILLAMMNKDPTVTGRTDLWMAVIGSIMKRPITGYGFQDFWVGKGESLDLSISLHWVMKQSQNGFLDVCLQLGIFGLLAVAVSLFKATKDAIYCLINNRDEDQLRIVEWCAIVLFLTAAYNLDESYLILPNNLFWMLYVLVCINLDQLALRTRLALRSESSLLYSADAQERLLTYG